MSEQWLCKLRWGWGKDHSFSEETEFYIWDRDDLEQKVKEKLVKIARRYAMDGDTPMRVWVSGIEVIPANKTEYIPASELNLDAYLENEVAYTRQLTANKQLYTENGNYNLTPSPNNK